MPDPFGKLSPEEFQKVLQWVNTRWKPHVPCEMCGAMHSWSVADLVNSPVNLGAGKNFYLGGPNYPQVQVICANCGNTKFLNAILVGIIPPENPGQGSKNG